MNDTTNTFDHLALIAVAGQSQLVSARIRVGASPTVELLHHFDGLTGCGTFASDRTTSLVFAAHKATSNQPPGIIVLHLDEQTGKLTALSHRDTADSLTYLTVSEDGSTLLGASYGGGFVSAWPIVDTQLEPATCHHPHRHPHCIIQTGSFAYAPLLGEDSIAQYRYRDGALELLTQPTAPAPAGSGPRHLIHSHDRFYAVTEFSGEVIRYTAGDDGCLHMREHVCFVDPTVRLQHSRLGANPREEHLIWGADVHRAGQYLLASERTSSTIAALPLTDGVVGRPVAFSRVEEQPRGFMVTPDGQYALVLGERSELASLMRVESSGHLTTVARVRVGHGANWARVVG